MPDSVRLPQCFRCNKVVEPAMQDSTPEAFWECPSEAAVFDATGNYGSALYDAPVTGVMPRILICDDCLREACGTQRLKEIKVNKAWEK